MDRKWRIGAHRAICLGGSKGRPWCTIRFGGAQWSSVAHKVPHKVSQAQPNKCTDKQKVTCVHSRPSCNLHRWAQKSNSSQEGHSAKLLLKTLNSNQWEIPVSFKVHKVKTQLEHSAVPMDSNNEATWRCCEPTCLSLGPLFDLWPWPSWPLTLISKDINFYLVIFCPMNYFLVTDGQTEGDA